MSHFSRRFLTRLVQPAFIAALVAAIGLGLPGTFDRANAASDMQISGITAAPTPVAAGGLVTIDFVIENSNVDPAANATYTIELPTGLAFQTVAPSGQCNYASIPHQVQCNFGTLTGTLSGGAPVAVQVVLKANVPVASNDVVVTVNTTVATTSPELNTANNTQPIDVTVTKGADLSFKPIMPTPNPVVASGTVTYPVIVTNAGPNAAVDATAVFTLPPGLTYASFTGSGWSHVSTAGQVVTLTYASSIGVNADAALLNLRATVVANATGVVTMQADVSSTTRDGNPNNAVNVDVSIVAGTDLAVVKSINADPVIGASPVTFTLQVNNIGQFPASGLTLTDTVPPGFTSVAASGSGWTCGVTGNDVSCTRPGPEAPGSLPPVLVTATAPDNSLIPVGGSNATNSATIASVTTDPVSSNNTGSVTFGLKKKGADLAISMSRGPNLVPINTNIASSLAVLNKGPLAATGKIYATYQLAAGEQLISYNSAAGWSCSPSPAAAGLLVTCELAGGLAVGATTAAINLVTRAAIAGVVGGRACTSTGANASFTPPEGDVDPGNDCTGIDGSVTATAASANLRVTKSAAPAVLAATANSVTFQITVTNAGPDSATSVVLTDAIPNYTAAFFGRPATTVAAIVVSAPDAAASCPTVGQTVQCTLGTLAKNDTATVRITLDRPMVDGFWNNTASAYSTDVGDPDRSDNLASASYTVGGVADVEVTGKTASPNPVQAGVETAYVISIRNNGPSKADAVTVRDVFTIPPGAGTFTYISSTSSNGGTCGWAAGTLTATCDFGTMQPGELQSMTVRIRPDYMAAPPAPRQLGNVATISTTTQESNTGNNSLSATLDITDAAVDLQITQKDLADPANFDTLSPLNNYAVYKFDVRNNGPSYATGVNFTDSWTGPTGKTLTFVCDLASATASSTCSGAPAGTCMASGAGASCNVGNLATGMTSTRYLLYRIDQQPANSGTTYNKSAVVTGNEMETVPKNNTALEQTTVRVIADLEVVSKTASQASVNINEAFSWSVVVRNNGPGAAAASTLTDTLPTGMVLTGLPTTTLGSCIGAVGGTGITCDFGDMNAAGPTQSATITLPVKMIAYPSGGTSTNTAKAKTDSIDTNPNNNTKSGNVLVIVSSIAGDVFNDYNDDGVRQVGEPGIDNVSVRLRGKDAYGNDVDITVQTSGGGKYKFINLPPSGVGGYTITEAQPSGYLDGKDSVGGAVVTGSKGTDSLGPIALGSGKDLTGYQFGELASTSIAGRVWHDASNDGLISSGEATFIDGVTVTLNGVDDLGVTIATQTNVTSGGGRYSFTGLRPGTYTVTEAQPAAYLPGQAARGTGANGAGGAGTAFNTLTDPAFGNAIKDISLRSGDAAIDYNFGELLPASIAGSVYFDADKGNTKNAGDTPIGGVTIKISGKDYRGNTIAIADVTTDPNGNYIFPSLIPSDAAGYTITEVQPAMYTDGAITVGTSGGTAGTNTVTAIKLGSGIAATGYHFGEVSPAISGSVFNDLNDDGVRDVAEVGIPSVTITLTGCGVNRTILTDASGNYTFSGIPACATYTLTETQPVGYADGKTKAGIGAGGTAAVNVITGINLNGSTVATLYNFGEHGKVPTNLTCSTPAQGPKNVREPFNWLVTVSNTAGGAAPTSTYTSTLPTGLVLTGLPSAAQGTCTGVKDGVAVACTLGFIPAGQSVIITVPVRATTYATTPTAGSLKMSGTVGTEGMDTTAGDDTCNGTLTLQQSTLGGTVFVDPNNNGVKDTGEVGIKDAVITLTGKDLYGNDVNVTAQTIADGTYRFTGLAPADATGYTIVETQPAGFADGKDTVGDKGGVASSNDTVTAIKLAAATDANNYNFAEIAQGLAGKVYVDSNNDGIADPTEPGIANVTLRVTGVDINGLPVDQTITTAADGTYLFGNLPPSNTAGYTLTETQPVVWADGKVTPGTAGGTAGVNKITKLVLPAGQISTGYNFGERGAEVCGYVYNDTNNNGIKEKGEVGIPDVKITLSGADANGLPVSQVLMTQSLSAGATSPGRYCFRDLPLPNGAGYTISETQPANLTNGKTTVGTGAGGVAGNDVISGITFTQPGASGDNYNFGEIDNAAAKLSGFVWLDANHDRSRNEPIGRAGWTVELIRGVVGGANTTIATTTTAADGSYRFDGLPPGTEYSVVFRSPQGNYIYGFLQHITLVANTELTEQNQPIDPSGVVYDELTRRAVPGARVTLTGPAGFDPTIHLVGGPSNVTQTTDSTGEYKYLLLPSAPPGTYGLQVGVPTGYVQRISTAIPPCTATLTVGALPAPALVQLSDTAPGLAVPVHAPGSCAVTSGGLAIGQTTTQYYLNFILSATSANLVNNHIPIEATPTPAALVVTKTTPKLDVTRGELVPYTITIRNALPLRQTGINIVDMIPPGFKYRETSASVDGVRREPDVLVRQLTWTNLTIERNQTVTIKLLLTVGAGVGEGEFINQAWAVDQFTGLVASNVAKAPVRIVPDPTFDCTDLIGKVFDDTNRNGYQDDGERGIANVRVVSVRGQLITTDSEGRFHIACADIPDSDRGSNFILKLDERTLPTGYRMTTENPRVIRITRGKMAKINFGASIHRVVRVDLTEQAFEPGVTQLRPHWVTSVQRVIDELALEKSVLRVAYSRVPQESASLAQDRVRAIVAAIREQWRTAGHRSDLMIETEFFTAAGGGIK